MILAAPTWSGDQLSGNWDVLLFYALDHLRITLLALALGTAVAFPLALAAYRWSSSYPPILAVTNALYSVPSLALITLLGALFGEILSDNPLIVTLAIYTLAILVRNIVEGLRAVPAEVSDAALAVGYTPRRRLFRVQLPLALPAIIAGFRVATVSTVSLVTVGGVLGLGGLGFMFFHGYRRDLGSEIWAGIIASVLLALVLDSVIVVTGKLLTPWTRKGASR